MVKNVDQRVRCGRPLIAPNCCLSKLFLTNSRIQPPTIDSNTFDSVEVEDISRRSHSVFLGGLVLRIGTTSAFFYMTGTIPSRTGAWNMAHTGSASQTELSRRIQFRILSGSHDLLLLMLLNLRSTVYADLDLVIKALNHQTLYKKT